MRSIYLLLGLIAFGAVLAGCGGPSGPPTYPVTGEVTFDGKPLPTEGTIIFAHAAANLDADVAQIIDGKFSLQVTEGKKQVQIHAAREVPGEVNTYGAPLVQPYIPQKYNGMSILTKQVSATDENHFVFNLESEPSK